MSSRPMIGLGEAFGPAADHGDAALRINRQRTKQAIGVDVGRVGNGFRVRHRDRSWGQVNAWD